MESWGSLPANLKEVWNASNCNSTVSSTPATTATTPTAVGGGGTTSAPSPPSHVVGGPAPLPQIWANGTLGCGYKGLGSTVQISDSVSVCLPPVVCNPATCPPGLGKCVNGQCQLIPPYQALKSYPHAYATYYCDLPGGGCHGVTQVEFPEVTAAKLSTLTGKPVCAEGKNTDCVGIAASSPMMVGDSQIAVDPTGAFVREWGLGLSEASNVCYELTGPGGTVTVALTDSCGGYVSCNGSGPIEGGPCTNAADFRPNCPCVGTVPGMYSSCCGMNCGGPVNGACDWCSSNTHPHFDLDTPSFNYMCAAQGINGSCEITSVKPVTCDLGASWPPGGTGAGGGESCGANSFDCSGTSPDSANQPLVPGTQCCCAYGAKPQSDGSCK